MAEPIKPEEMTREQLNVHALTVGVEKPESFGTKTELLEAVTAATKASDTPDIDTHAVVTPTHAGVNSPGQDSGTIETHDILNQSSIAADAQPGQKVGVYIVDGQTVDANGKPVAS